MEVHRIATETHLETGHAYLRSLTNGRTRQVQLRTADELPNVGERRWIDLDYGRSTSVS